MNYWFLDNWYGEERSFRSIFAALKAARRQMGAVTIYQDQRIAGTISGRAYYA